MKYAVWVAFGLILSMSTSHSLGTDTVQVIAQIGRSGRRTTKLFHITGCKTDGVGSTLKHKEDIPMLPFYGFDEKQRHIGGVGYGLFEGG